MNHRIALPALIALFAPLAAEAAAPSLIPVTGYLTDANGLPIDGTVDIDFKIYRTATGATSQWSNGGQPMSVDVFDGQFTAYLGADAALDLALFKDNTDLFLGMAVDGAAEMTPRFEMGSAPFAGYAKYCDDAYSVGGMDISQLRLAADDILWSEISTTTIPAGLDDGDDVGPTYTAGIAIGISADQISVDKSIVDGWARAVAFDSQSELTTALNSVYMAKQTCAANQVLMADGAGGWGCTDSTALPLSETVIDGFLTNNLALYATNASVATLTGRVAATETSIGTLQTQMGTANTNITTLQAQVGASATAAGNLSAQYEFNETSGTSFADASPFTATANINNGGVLVGAGGHAGSGVGFADKGILVATGNKIPDSAQVWVEAWVQPQLPLSQNRVVVDKTGAYRLRQNSGGIMEFTVTAVTGSCTVTHPSPVSAGTWAHVAGYYDGQFVTIEVNGAPASLACTKGPVASTIGGVMGIGGTWNGSAYVEGYQGVIDEVRIRPTAPAGSSGYYNTSAYPPVPRLATSTGGTVTTSGAYRIHTFTSSGTFVAAGGGAVEVLVVAGGGSGGANNTTNGNGGGGAGGVIVDKFYEVSPGNVTVTVGAGGASVNGVAVGNDGQNSAFGTLTALGGGGGGSAGAGAGRPGGSGGGGASNNIGNRVYELYGTATQPMAAMLGYYGNRGGAGDRAWTGGGGGGAGGPGQNGFAESDRCCGGNGGPGIASDISGSVQYYAGGGGGGGNSSERAGDGYDGGGRGYGTTSFYAYNVMSPGVNSVTRGSSTFDAIPNTGGGGGAGSYWAGNVSISTRSGAGGSGIVIVRYVP